LPACLAWEDGVASISDIVWPMGAVIFACYAAIKAALEYTYRDQSFLGRKLHWLNVSGALIGIAQMVHWSKSI
jgi:hypothetical protein